MVAPLSGGEGGPAPEGVGPGAGRRGPTRVPLLVAGLVVVVAAVAAGGFLTRPDGSKLVGSPPPTVTATSSTGAGSASAAPRPSATGPSGPSSGSLLAVVDDGGGLATMDDQGGAVISHALPGVVFGFPAWSPDGSRLAAVGSRAGDTSIYVFSVRRSGPSDLAEPVVVYRSAVRPPFYLYWTPDGKSVAFLAIESDGLSLRIAPADGSAPLDGSGPGTILRRGAPLYFDWETSDRALLHVGLGSTAFVGQIGTDGKAVGSAVAGTGNFRLAGASRDGRYLAYVRAGTSPPGEIVVASQDGASHHELPVFGPAAFNFDPTGDGLASIAADKPDAVAASFPLGPLRLMNARTGAVSTLLDGSVVAFFWAPDGRTIAALRLPAGGQAADAGPVLAAAVVTPAAAAATPPPGADVRVVFVDVSTGAVRSDHTVRLAPNFVGGILPYFDQYALSHRLWAPDSGSILLPLIDATGREQLVVVPSDGTADRPIASGVSGFWSP